MYIAKGTCQVLLPNQQLQNAAAGQVVLIDCYVPHEYGFDSNSEVAWIHFDGPLARDFYDLIVSASKEGVVHNRIFFVILTTDSFEALFISYFKPAGIW